MGGPIPPADPLYRPLHVLLLWDRLGPLRALDHKEIEDPAAAALAKVRADQALDTTDWSRLAMYGAALDLRTPASYFELSERWDSVPRWSQGASSGSGSKGGWGMPGGVLMLPLSPEHLMLTQIGSAWEAPTTLSIDFTALLQIAAGLRRGPGRPEQTALRGEDVYHAVTRCTARIWSPDHTTGPQGIEGCQGSSAQG
jgi:hypothetical protein